MCGFPLRIHSWEGTVQALQLPVANLALVSLVGNSTVGEQVGSGKSEKLCFLLLASLLPPFGCIPNLIPREACWLMAYGWDNVMKMGSSQGIV